ncbi:MAG: dicarboxylate/amino acid:cation symporter [Clostridiaceae bacterium]|nr:dicarboxylate/amino acid:cation symporter [Clostridiaceae bacterium]
MSVKQKGLTTKILAGLVLGIVTGIILYFVPEGIFRDTVIVDGLFLLVGQVFLRGIMMMVVPLVFISLVNGSASMGDIKKLGRIGVRTVLFYLVTTAVAISIALGLASIVNPGLGLDLSNVVTSEPTINEGVPLVEVLIDMVPRNPVAAMSSGNMLQIIVFAVFIGVGLSALGERTKGIVAIFDQLNELIMKMVGFVMLLAPYGVFALIARTFANEGFDVMIPLAKYMLTVIAALIIHAIVTYGGMLKGFTGLSPIRFFKKFFPAFSVAFSTASSGATLPVTIETVEEQIGVSKNVASFTLPLGATINMDGTAIMQGVATIFIAQVYGIELGFSAILTVILTATLASIGTAGVPGVGLIMLSMVLQSVGLPVEGIALIMGIDRLLDMSRTAINITGDAVCSTIIAKAEGEFDQSIFDADSEGTTA